MKSTIRFKTELLQTHIALPKTASAKLPGRGKSTIEGMINGFPFRAVLEPDGKGGHEFKVSKALRDAAGTEVGDTVAVEITRVDDESEIRVPAELSKTLASAPKARETWENITPMARREWVLWMNSTKNEETRLKHVEKMSSMLASGKKRVCCFGGLKWITRDYKVLGGTWVALPKVAK